MKIIALCGKKGVGKDVVGNALKGIGYYGLQIAAPLKYGVMVMFGLTDEHVNGSLKEVPCDALNGMTPRHVLQRIGTESVQNILGKDIWIKHTVERIKSLSCKRFVITDVRFPHECDYLYREFGRENVTVVKIVRKTSEVDDHISENCIDYIQSDQAIYNDGTVMDLIRRGLQIPHMQEIRKMTAEYKDM